MKLVIGNDDKPTFVKVMAFAIRNNFDPDLCRHMASLDYNGLNPFEVADQVKQLYCYSMTHKIPGHIEITKAELRRKYWVNQ